MLIEGVFVVSRALELTMLARLVSVWWVIVVISPLARAAVVHLGETLGQARESMRNPPLYPGRAVGI